MSTASQKKARKAWVDALRSGKFKQATGELEHNGKYCCLGVACVLYNESRRAQKKGQLADSWKGNGTLNGSAAVVKSWLGLATADGDFTTPDRGSTLADENDGGATFKQIAKIIEAEPEGLFT